MQEDDDEAFIWNRSLGWTNASSEWTPELFEGAHAGDRALHDTLKFHSAGMNGGLSHAFDMRSPGQVAAACAGYRYLGLPGVADLIERAAQLVDAEGVYSDDDAVFEAFESEFLETSDDSDLYARFTARLAAAPQDFAPR